MMIWIGKVSIEYNNSTINDVMGPLLAGTDDISYEVNGPRVMITYIVPGSITTRKNKEEQFCLKNLRIMILKRWKGDWD